MLLIEGSDANGEIIRGNGTANMYTWKLGTVFIDLGVYFFIGCRINFLLFVLVPSLVCGLAEVFYKRFNLYAIMTKYKTINTLMYSLY